MMSQNEEMTDLDINSINNDSDKKSSFSLLIDKSNEFKEVLKDIGSRSFNIFAAS